MRRVLATDGLAKSSGVNISVSSKAEMDSTGADKSDEGYVLQQVNFCVL